MMLDRYGKEFRKEQKSVPRMINYGDVDADHKAIIEAAQTPGFGSPGMTFKQRIAAATAIFKKIKEEKAKMNRARQIARDYIAPMMVSGIRVLDICAGDGWIRPAFPNVVVAEIDKKSGYDLTDHEIENMADFQNFDIFVSCYGLQHLLNEEARIWTILRRYAKPETKFVYVGRFAQSPRRETDRQDPLNAYDGSALSGLALASGWRIVDFVTYRYEADQYFVTSENANAFAATMEPI